MEGRWSKKPGKCQNWSTTECVNPVVTRLLKKAAGVGSWWRHSGRPAPGQHQDGRWEMGDGRWEMGTCWREGPGRIALLHHSGTLHLLLALANSPAVRSRPLPRFWQADPAPDVGPPENGDVTDGPCCARCNGVASAPFGAERKRRRPYYTAPLPPGPQWGQQCL